MIWRICFILIGGALIKQCNNHEIDLISSPSPVLFESITLQSTQPLIDIRRKHKIGDFVWPGSGDGPTEQDGGLAWEDSPGGDGGKDDGTRPGVILITKTMLVFKTVLTTVYPELTPTVVISIPDLESTPHLPTPVPSPSSSPNPPSPSPVQPTIEPSPSFSLPIEPTATPPLIQNITTPRPEDEIPIVPISNNPVYWVNTVIKANASDANTTQFQKVMQKNLAVVYASAFKRHLLNSLGIFNRSDDETSSLRRKRRSVNENSQKRNYGFPVGNDRSDVEWILLSTMERSTSPNAPLPGTTAMNVSVSIVNITTDEEIARVSMEYIVIAEGKPVLAASAVQDMTLVSKSEMESQIGYEVIKKAEALLPTPAPVVEIKEGRTSPWLIVAVTSIVVIILLIILILMLIWKWKHYGESRVQMAPRHSQRPHSVSTGGSSSGGVINPNFQRSPSLKDVLLKREHEGKRDQGSGRLRSNVQNVGMSQPPLDTIQRLAKDLETTIVPAKGSSGTGSLGESSSSPPSATVIIQPASSSTNAQQDNDPSSATTKPKRLRERKVKGQSPIKRPAGIVKSTRKEERRPLSGSSRDKVSFGHLDICDDPIAKPISQEAKKIIQPRAKSSRPRPYKKGNLSRTTSGVTKDGSKIVEEGQPKLFPTVAELVIGTEDEDSSIESYIIDDERDRDFEERVDTSHIRRIDIPSKPTTRDVKVQTPKRSKVIVGRPQPKPRHQASPKTKMSAESLISTEESEEIIEVHHLDDPSSGETNPLGKMRRRFHQFLDDAFNVIGKREEEFGEDSRSKSAKVSLTHHIETKEVTRPWTTSHVSRQEETVESASRPKSASVGPPKRAWTASTERRCQSASSRGQVVQSRVIEENESDNEPDQNSSPLDTMSGDVGPSLTSSNAPIFPRYPIYPDVPYPTNTTLESQNLAGTSSQDPAVPLIAAIKEEIKRFERLKITEHEQHQFHSRWST